MKFGAYIFILCLVNYCVCEEQFNPYQVLNIPKSATTSQIRQSYKKLVKEWHPDKNQSPDAQDKFIQIQQAYEILSNGEKREQYDTHGFTSDNQKQWRQQAQNFRYSDFFSEGFYDFKFDETSSRSISYHQFRSRVLPDSHHTPQMLYVYSTFCARCIVILKSSWERAAKDLEKLGVGVSTVDTTFSSRISSQLRVYSLPTIVMVYEEQYFYYNGVVSYDNVKKFVTSQLPSNLVQNVGSSNIVKFLRDITDDDKPRALLFSKQMQPTLLYTLMAIKHQKYIRFGFASLSDDNTKSIAKKYGVRGFGPTLLIFKEDLQSPAVTLQSSDMPQGAVNEILTLHRYMRIPRLTSQEVFDDVCPSPNRQSFHVSLCAIFVANQKRGYLKSLNNLRDAVSAAMETDDQLSDWLKFIFVLDSKQSAFVSSLSGDEKLPDEPSIYLIWRRGPYRTFVNTHSSNFLESDVSLEYGFQKFLAFCLQTSHQRQFERQVHLSPLNDELAPFFITRLALQAWKKSIALIGYVTSSREQEAMLFIIAIGAIMLSWAFGSNAGNGNTSRRTPPVPQEEEDEDDVEVEVASDDEDEVAETKPSYDSLKELQPSTYQELVLRQKRGHMTIVVLLDESDHVMNNFQHMMKKCESGLSFAFLKMSSYLSWYVELRQTSSPQPSGSKNLPPNSSLSSLHSTAHLCNTDLDITAASAHGTVLAINGSKHWYCIFVPRTGRQPAAGGVHVMTSNTNDVNSSGDVTSKQKGQHDVTERSDIAHTPPQVYAASDTASEYAIALDLWLGRVRDGQLPRLYVRQWPGLYDRAFDDSDAEENF